MNKNTNTGLEPSSRVVRSEAIDFTEIDDSVVMMDVDEGRYYELDSVGARVWSLVESGPRVAAVCEALAAEYEVDPETCRQEVRAFLDELIRLAVVRVRQPDEANGGGENDDATGWPAAAQPQIQGESRSAPLSWTTPTIRVMSHRRVASGDNRNVIEGRWYHVMS